MTTYAPTFTSRWRGTYRAGGIQHTIQFRGARGATYSTMDGYGFHAYTLFTALQDHLFDDFEWIAAEVALTDTEEFLPATLPSTISGAAIDGSALSAKARIMGLTFSGKAAGSRARCTVFGTSFFDTGIGSPGGDGIISPSDFGGISTAITQLNAWGYANSGAIASWHNRATYKENDHLLKLVRRGTIS